ncbi:MAG: structural protein [Macrobrachium rosenbergii virus 5]|nr:MAG: structural protein [Macrobrachium rosenbergii virus 5]
MSEEQTLNCPGSLYQPQSGTEIGQSVSTGDANLESEIVAFSDENAGMVTAMDSSYEPTMDAAYNADSDLGTYLQRPVEIDTSSWLVGQPYFLKINPWELWKNNKWVAKKLANYELLRCKLHVKFVINGTQFHYGKIIVGYNPFSGPFDQVTVTRNFNGFDLVQLSQKPHVFLDPSDGEGASMLLPYFWNDNYFSLTKQDMNNAGDLYFKSMGTLQTASSGTDPVTITTYAWAEDVVLTMPTSLNEYIPQWAEDSFIESSVDAGNYQPQAGNSKSKGSKNTKTSQGKPKKAVPKAMNSGDEYGTGVISQPAQAIAKAAGALEMVPFIAPYARASGMIATKVGQIASLFGYARPNIVTDRQTYSPELAGVMANVNASDTSHKLSLDSKQEVSIDSRVAGLTGEDEMTANSILTRESYVTSFTFDESDAAGKLLWNTYITPSMFASYFQELHMTPACLWSQHFNYWQGSIKLRFQIVKSKFHKGRILLRWDPRSHSAAIDTNAVYSRIVDITDQDDFEVTIGWGQSDPFLNCITAQPGFEPYSTSRLTTDNSGSTNGVLEVNVVNQLVSPDGDSPIRINVFASMCDDAKFGQPVSSRITALSPFVPQGGYEPQSGEGENMAILNDTTDPTCPDSLDTIGEELAPADETMNVFFGETITSLRELIKRYQFTRGISKPDVSANTITTSCLRMKAQPYIAGWDQFGLDLAANDVTPLTIGNNGPLALWNLCYAGWRGGIRHKLAYSSNIEGTLRCRRVDHNNNYGFTQQTESTSQLDGDITKFLSAKTFRNGWDGMYLNHAQYNKVVEVEIPFYTGKRFLPSRLVHADSTLGDALEVCETFVSGDNAPKKVYVEDYVAAGDDYSLMFFTGVPVLYRYYLDENSVPTP